MTWVLYVLILLHAPDGRVIAINPNEITSMFEPAGAVHEDVKCIVNMADGKYNSVTEECSTIQKMIEGERK